MSEDTSRPVSRRRLLALLGASGATGVAGCSSLGIGGGSDGESTDGGAGGDGADDGGAGGTTTPSPTATPPTGGDGGTPTRTETATPTETQSPSPTQSGGSTPAADIDATVQGGPGGVVDAHPQYQYDAANTGTGDTAGVNSEPSVAWAWPQEPGGSPFVRQFAAAGSTVFATRVVERETAARARVVALDGKSGELLWQRDLPERTARQGGLAVADGSLYLIAGRSLFSLDAASGDTEWSVEHGTTRSAPAVADGTVYASDNTAVTAYSAADGSQVWSHTPETSESLVFTESPAVRDGRVFVGAQHLQALSPADGSVQWTARVNSKVTAAPTVGPERAYVPTDAGETFGFDVADGARSWQSSAMSEAFTYENSPALVGDTLYLTSDDKVAALARSDASVRWSVTSTFDDTFSTPTVVDGAIYTSFVGRVQARSANGGDQLWAYQGNANMSSGTSHPMVVDGYVYYRDGNRQLVALSA